MKRTHIFLALISLILVFSKPGIKAETHNATLFKIFHTLDFYDRNNGEEYLIDLLFVPIGWSKDGKFAYIKEIEPGGADYYETGLFRWIVQDMVTDKILWISEKEKAGDYPAEYWKMDSEELFHWMLGKFMAKNRPKLEEYGIILNSDLEIQRFPLQYKNAEYRGFLMDVVRGTKYDIPNVIKEYKNCVAKDDVIKVVGHMKDEYLVDVGIGGYVISPYEDRIALLTCEIVRGWEGPPHVAEFEVVGCHLEYGY